MLAHLPYTKLLMFICFVVPEEPYLSALVIHLVIWLLPLYMCIGIVADGR